MRSLLFVFFYFFSLCSISQTAEIDSLVDLRNSTTGEARFEANLELAKKYAKVRNYEECFNSINLAKNFAEVKNDPKLKAQVYYQMGRSYYAFDNSTESIKYFDKSLIIPGGLKAFEQLDAYVKNGNNHSFHGKTKEAITLYKKALSLKDLAEAETGKDYYYPANNLAISLADIGEYDSSRYYHDICLATRRASDNQYGIGQTLNNIGSLFYAQQKFDSALFYFEKGHIVRTESGVVPMSGVYESKINIGKALAALGEFEKAEEILIFSYDTVSHYGNFALEIRIAEQLHKLYTNKGKYDQALRFNEIFHAIKDSMYGAGQKEEIVRLQQVNKYEEQILQDSLIRAEESKRLEVQQRQEDFEDTVILLIMSGIVLFLIGIVFLILRNLKAKKKSAAIILEQKLEVEKQRDIAEKEHLEAEKQRKIALTQKDILAERNKEITDSISYALRIQKAILPSDQLFHSCFKDAFVFYKPKDIVAGDFYWIEQADDNLFIAVADCTGHGVPGAMVSVVCHNALNRSVKEFGLRIPCQILDKTREIVIETFAKSEEEVKDGMDISLCKFSGDGTYEWAGAHNPLWIVREGSDVIEEIKGDKQPIGSYEFNQPFTNHEVELNKNDQIYLFSDGFQDQFGGDKGKKFKTGNLKKLIASISKKSMDQQSTALDSTLEAWSGEIEQVDDVCIIGLRIV